MTASDLIVSSHDGVTTIQLNRPPNNMLDADLLRALADQLDQLAVDGATRCVVLGATGKHFCGGADFSGERANEPLRPVAAGIYGQAKRLFRSPLPIVAALQGAAVGGGLGLACAADFRIATDTARLVPNFSRLGFHQGFGLTVTLPRIVGEQRALELLLKGVKISGSDAAAIGLVDRVVTPEDLPTAATEFAQQIAAAAPLAVRSIRRTMRDGLADRVDAAIELELSEQDRLSHTHDWAEGIRAANDRREPQFLGR